MPSGVARANRQLLWLQTRTRSAKLFFAVFGSSLEVTLPKRTSAPPPVEPPERGPVEGARLLPDLAERGKQLAAPGALARDDRDAWRVAVEGDLETALGRNHEAISAVAYAG